MVKKVVCHVVADISEDTTAVRQHTGIPVVVEDRMRQLPERSSKKNKQSRWHHKSILIHGQVVMDAVQEEMQDDANSIVRKKPSEILEYSISTQDSVGSHTNQCGTETDASRIQSSSKGRVPASNMPYQWTRWACPRSQSCYHRQHTAATESERHTTPFC